ncbi:MAG: hypothetical protein HRU36_02405 [Rickettsiales bacterium]|nr:hypothetical protein [Rickettsiales bacterium]
MHYYQSQFVSNIKDIYGKIGEEWLEQLPIIIEQFERDWEISIVAVAPNLTYSFVATVRLEDSSQGILKIAPCSSRSDAEIEWYRLQKFATPKLYDANPSMGAILMEKLVPGDSVKNLVVQKNDDVATKAICTTIKNLGELRIADNRFKHVSDLKSSLNILDNRVEKKLLDKAKDLLKDLTSDRSDDALLHGDLHHDNILSTKDSWKAIDPHGYVGPKAFEVGAMLRNPWDCFPKDTSLEKVIKRRRDILCAELPYNSWEIDGWLYVYTMIATGWSFENHKEIPDVHMAIINILGQLIKI